MFTLDTLWVILALIVFAGLIVGLVFLKRKTKLGFALRALIALGLGIGYGVVVQAIFGAESASGAGADIKKWIGVVGTGFTRGLQLIIVPLVFVSIVKAFTRFGDSKTGAKKAGKIIAFLLITTAVSAAISIATVGIFNLKIDLTGRDPSSAAPSDVAGTLLNLVPSNFFAALSGGSVLPVVLIAAVVGAIHLAVRRESSGIAVRVDNFLETVYEYVMKAVEFIIRLTPYGILAIIAVRTASGSAAEILKLGLIIAASFTAMAAVFLLHLVIAWLTGVNPVKYLKKTAPALLFAFSSRSSAATLPLTIDAQRKLGVSEANADLAGSLGTCIGQNGCAGVYPVMVAMLVGFAQGLNVWSISFILPLIIYAVIASIGTAGVGGGATNVSLMVLSMIGLPIELVAILISVDFIIDMGRTALNVNDSILAGYVVGRFENDIDEDLLNDRVRLEEVRKKEALLKHTGENI